MNVDGFIPHSQYTILVLCLLLEKTLSILCVDTIAVFGILHVPMSYTVAS